jgi:hypothetical protein
MDMDMDILVTTTLQVSHLKHSRLGGEYHTWAKGDTPLHIHYTPNGARAGASAGAYFDGICSMGIHVGAGYVTGDVIAHGWEHRYLMTTTGGVGLLFQHQPGVMGEAFADTLGKAVDILNDLLGILQDKMM